MLMFETDGMEIAPKAKRARTKTSETAKPVAVAESYVVVKARSFGQHNGKNIENYLRGQGVAENSADWHEAKQAYQTAKENPHAA